MTVQLRQFEPDTTKTPNSSKSMTATVYYPKGLAPQRNLYNSMFKRFLDVTLVLIALPIVLPIILILSILTARDGQNPFFSQKRTGRNGRVFNIWKLRSMVPNADQRLEEYLNTNSAARKEWDEKQKLVNDPRITRFGKILRKTSMDELPQLWNVLIGDMSLVGPRPMMVEQCDLYPGTAYYALRPGITGYWQVSDRHNSSFAARAKFDNKYYREVNLSTDVKVLAQTVRVVLQGTGC